MQKWCWMICGVFMLAGSVKADPTTLSLSPDAERLKKVDTNKGQVAADFGEYIDRTFSRYEPVYIIAGTDPQIKFQFSGKYQLINDYYFPGKPDPHPPWWTKFYLAYTQTSLWDISAPSAPFYDTTYRPEIFWQTDRVIAHPLTDAAAPPYLLIDFRTGLTHESNGKSGADSRSMNSFFIEPTIELLRSDDYFFKFQPKMKVYLGDLSDNPDITEYRGYADFKFIVGSDDGLQAAILGRIGDHGDKGSVQLDVTYPVKKLFPRIDALCIDFQVFNGFGEDLLDYNQSATTFRVGCALVR